MSSTIEISSPQYGHVNECSTSRTKVQQVHVVLKRHIKMLGPPPDKRCNRRLARKSIPTLVDTSGIVGYASLFLILTARYHCSRKRVRALLGARLKRTVTHGGFEAPFSLGRFLGMVRSE